MNHIVTPEKLKNLRERYPKGARVKLMLLRTYSGPNLQEGDMGTVMCVDNAGTVHVEWNNGFPYGMKYGRDFCTVMYSGNF